MGLFGGNNNDRRLKQCSIYLQTLNSELLTMHLTFLEKERYMMGLVTAEDYKKFLEGVSDSKWNHLKFINQLRDEEKKEERSNEH